MKKTDDIELRYLDADALRDEARNKLNAAEDAETPDAAEVERLTAEYRAADVARAAVRTEYRESIEAKVETGAPVVEDAETRERIGLRNKPEVTLTGFITSHLQGRMPSGALAEYAAACGVKEGAPIDVFEKGRPAPVEHRADAATTVPAGGAQVNVGPVQPFVVAQSIAAKFGWEMPVVGSGNYTEMTISTGLTAAPKNKGDAQESTAAILTPETAAPRRFSCRLTVNIEDIYQAGTPTYDSALRQNAGTMLSDRYDAQAIGGDGVAPNINGLINQLTDPADPTEVADFDALVASFADSIDGLWAARMSEVMMCTNPAVYKLSAKAFRDIAAADLGSISFADYAMQHMGGWFCSKRMPDATAGNIARAIIFRMGMPGMRTVVHPIWANLVIEDQYSDSATGQRHVTLHLLCGSKVLIVQPDAYDLAEFKVA